MSDQNKHPYPNFIGPSYTSTSTRFDCSRTVNMYLENDVAGSSKEQQSLVLLSTPGLKKVTTIGDGPIRCLHVPTTNPNILYAVSGDKLYKCSIDFVTITLMTGTLKTSTGPVQMADNGVSIMFVDGTSGYYSGINSNSLTEINSVNFYPADTICFQDGYFILNRSGTAYLFFSDLYDVTFPELNLANKSGDSDLLTAVVSNNRQIYLFGEKTTEVWWNSGGVSLIPGPSSGVTPFTRQDGRYFHFGCESPATIKRVNSTLFWLGKNKAGNGIVFSLENEQPVRISTHAVETQIQKQTDLSKSTAWSVQLDGHYFYILNTGSDTTWCYDLANQSWIELQSNKSGVVGRHLAEVHERFQDTHIVGDYSSGNLYEWDLNTYTDNGNPITRLRQSPHLSIGNKQIFYKLFELDFFAQPALIDSAKVMLQISNDGGKTFGNELQVNTGAIGDYKKRVRWHRLGVSRDRVFRVKYSAPTNFQILNCWLDIQEGTS